MLKVFHTNINNLGKDYKSIQFDNKGTTEVNNETSSKVKNKYHKKVSFKGLL